MVSQDFSKLIVDYLSNGFAEKSMAWFGISEFSSAVLSDSEYEFSGDDAFGCWSVQMLMSCKNNPIYLIGKIYVSDGDFVNNGFSVRSNIRLSSIIKTYLSYVRGVGQKEPVIRIFLNDEASEGAVLINNMVVLQFLCKDVRSEYCISTIETDWSSVEKWRGKGLSTSLLHALYPKDISYFSGRKILYGRPFYRLIRKLNKLGVADCSENPAI